MAGRLLMAIGSVGVHSPGTWLVPLGPKVQRAARPNSAWLQHRLSRRERRSHPAVVPEGTGGGPHGREHCRRVCNVSGIELNLRRQMNYSPKETADNVLKESHRLLIDQLCHHVAQYSAHGIEALVSLANVLQPHVVQQNLLNDENGYSLAELGTGLHDTEAEWDDLGCEQEIDNFTAVIFNQCANDAERCEAEVFEWSRLGGGIEEWVEEERDVSCARD